MFDPCLWPMHEFTSSVFDLAAIASTSLLKVVVKKLLCVWPWCGTHSFVSCVRWPGCQKIAWWVSWHKRRVTFAVQKREIDGLVRDFRLNALCVTTPGFAVTWSARHAPITMTVSFLMLLLRILRLWRTAKLAAFPQIWLPAADLTITQTHCFCCTAEYFRVLYLRALCEKSKRVHNVCQPVFRSHMWSLQVL